MNTDKIYNCDYVIRLVNRSELPYESFVKTGKYKPLTELDIDNCVEPIHIHILTDGYLYRLLSAVKNGDVLNLQECGDLLGLSRERIRQIESKAIRKIKCRTKSKLKDFLYN